MTAGLLQPDDLTVQVVETYLKKPEYATVTLWMDFHALSNR